MAQRDVLVRGIKATKSRPQNGKVARRCVARVDIACAANAAR